MRYQVWFCRGVTLLTIIINTSSSIIIKEGEQDIRETHHSKIFLTNLPFASPPSGNVLWNAHAAGRLSCASAMMYVSISYDSAFTMYTYWRMRICASVESESTWMIELGVGEGRDCSLSSFVH